MYNKSILSASILIALSQGAYAEDHSTFNEVVVTATRTNSQIEDTAASVAVVTDKNIEESMVTGLDDLFEYTPGVTVKTNSRQGVQSINIRGIEGNRIKVLVDGVSQGNQFESGNTFINSARVNVDTDLIKAVEIVKVQHRLCMVLTQLVALSHLKPKIRLISLRVVTLVAMRSSTTLLKTIHSVNLLHLQTKRAIWNLWLPIRVATAMNWITLEI